MKKILELAKNLEKSEYKEQCEQISDFAKYFENEECLHNQQQAQNLLQKIADILLEAYNNQGYLNYYVKKFQNSIKDQENQKQISQYLKELCFLIHQYHGASGYNQNQKVILIQEYLSLHNSFQLINNDVKFQKHIDSYFFNNHHAQDLYQRYLKEFISQQGNSQKIQWKDFKQILITYFKDILDQKNKSEYNFNELVCYLKQNIDTKEDNAIDLEEIDQFFTQNFNNKDQSITIDDLYKIVESKVYKPIKNDVLQLNLVKYPQKFSKFYETIDTKYCLKPFQDRTVFGRKNDLKMNTVQIFPSEDNRFSRNQFQIIKDDMQNYYIENLHLSTQMYIKVTNIRQNVRKGFSYTLTDSSIVYIEDITPIHEEFVLGRNSIHPQLDFPYMELAANLNLTQVQNEEVDKFKNEGILYQCQKRRFSIGKSLKDDLQIDNTEEEQLVFEYIQNHGWVVYEPKPSKQGSYLKVNLDQQSSSNNEVDFNSSTKSIQYPKFQIFNNMEISLFDYSFKLNYLK